MTSLSRLNKYRAELMKYYREADKGKTPIHKPSRGEFQLSGPAESFVAERIEREVEAARAKAANH